MTEGDHTALAVPHDDPIAARARAFAVGLSDPDAGPELREAFDDWLAADLRHEVAYRRAVRVLGAVGDLDPALFNVRSRARPSFGRAWIGAAAAIAAALALVVFLPRPAPEAWSAARQTGVGELGQIVLADGSHVDLGPQSALQTDFSDKARRVRLTGAEAHFEVEKDASRPFIITVGDASVTVLGTQFDVKSACGVTRVSVAEGVVRFEDPIGAEAKPRELILRAGDAAELRNGVFSPVSHAVDVGGWRTRFLSYDDVSVCEVIADANRYGARIDIADPSLGALKVSVSYSVDQTPAMLASLEAALPIKAETGSDGSVRIVAKK